LPVPAGLACAVVHPHLEVETGHARQVLGESVPLADAVRQWANVGALVAGLFRSDLALVGRAIEDHIAEPRRAHLVAGFADVKRAAREAGALGCSLSGSGPSIFALCASIERAASVGAAMQRALVGSAGVDADVWISPVGPQGARVVAG
jgi:homoserine kinase